MIPEDWYDLAAPYLPGADRAFVEQQILQSAAAFCREVPVWVETLPPIDVEAGQDRYDPVPPPDTAIAQIIGVRLDGRLLRALDPVMFERGMNGYRYNPSTGLRLRPVPNRDIDRGLVVTASLWPRTTKALPEELLSRWQHAIVFGAVGRAMLMPDRPFSDRSASEILLREYRAGVARARYEYIAGYTRGAAMP